MADYHYQNITLTVDKESDLYKRAETQAARYGVTIEYMLENTVVMGLFKHMETALAFYEGHTPPGDGKVQHQRLRRL